MTHETAIETLAGERYLLDEMSEVERHRFEEHFFECEECAEGLRIASRLSRDGAAVFPPAPPGRVVHAPAMARRWRPSWMPSRAVVVPWAAAATLALALGLQVGRPGGDPFDSDLRVLATVPLRPATRGAVAAVALPPDSGGHLALALDVNAGAPGETVGYQIRREDGASIRTGQSIVPPVGTPMVVLVAAGPLRAGGQFVVTLRSMDNTVAPPAEYRFNVNAQ
jgi:hypothetical protein